MKTTAQANLQNAYADAGNRDKGVRVCSELRPDVLNIDATMIKFKKRLATFIS